MSQSAETKLQELRGKTNRQLVSLIGNRLDRGLAFALTLQDQAGDWETAEYFLGNAEKALGQAQSWMAALTGASQLEERRLKSKLAQLQDAIDHARASRVHMHAAC